MTQMGLEYAKLLEQRRHNVADESIRDTGNEISQQDANTRQYVASFKPREVDIEQHKADSSRMSAQASERQAGVAERKQTLDERYRERETQVKERQAEASAKQADASAKQASVAEDRYNLDSDYRERETAATELQAKAASEKARAKNRAQDLAELKNVVDRLPESVRTAWAAGNIPKKMDFGNPWYAAIAGVYNKWTGSLPSSKDIVNLIKFLG